MIGRDGVDSVQFAVVGEEPPVLLPMTASPDLRAVRRLNRKIVAQACVALVRPDVVRRAAMNADVGQVKAVIVNEQARVFTTVVGFVAEQPVDPPRASDSQRLVQFGDVDIRPLPPVPMGEQQPTAPPNQTGVERIPAQVRRQPVPDLYPCRCADYSVIRLVVAAGRASADILADDSSRAAVVKVTIADVPQFAGASVAPFQNRTLVDAR